MKKDVKKIEEQIYELRKTVRYDIRDLTVEQIVSKYKQSLDDDFEDGESSKNSGVIYIPEYQRDFTWDENRKSKLIESLILGLPIPFIFVAENKQGNWEIVDGSQRIRTLYSYISNDLKLNNLYTLDYLNHTHFKDLELSRQAKIKDSPLRLIVLSEETTDEVKKDMFERINRGSDLLKPMESRKGIYIGNFNDFIYEYAKNEKFKNLTPLEYWFEKRQEREELLLRFFGLMELYPEGIESTGVAKYLDKYLDSKNHQYKDENVFAKQKTKYEDMISEVIYIANKFFPYGFRRNHHPHTKRAVFEAISIGIAIFLKGQKKKNKSYKQINLNKDLIKQEILSESFRELTKGGQLHKQKKLKGRIDFIVNLLNSSVLE